MPNNSPDYDKNRESLDAARMRDSSRQQVLKKQDSNKQQTMRQSDMDRQRIPKTQDSHRQNIHAAANAARTLATAATPTGAVSLLKQIDFLGDIPYFVAIGAAALKDLLDLVFVGSILGLGTVITMLCSIFIFMMMLLVGSGSKKKVAKGIAKRIGVLLGGTLVEFIPGIDFFPVETVAVAIIYVMTLNERKNS